LNGSSSEHVVNLGLDSPESVVIDWVAHNLYWADSGIRRIEMSLVDGSSRRVLVWKDVDPRSIAVDPMHGYLYWSNWLHSPRVERSALDGTGRTTFVDDLSGRIGGLAIDFDASRLYWANIDGHNIESVNLLTGHDRLRVVTNLLQPYGLTQFKDFIYWTDKGTRTIERADKLNGMNQTRLQSSAEEIEDISIFHTSRQLGWNECVVHHGHCSHLCVAFPNNTGQSTLFHCICPTHFTLSPDNHNCIPPETFLLFSQRTAITRIIPDVDAPEVLLPIQGLKAVRALDFDPVDSMVYWIDGNSRTIRRAAETASIGSIFVQSVQGSDQIHPYDLAIDPYSRTVYWTDSYQNTINVTRIDGTSIGVIVEEAQGRSIALAPEEGQLFWATTGRRIMRAAADGTSKEILVSTGIGNLGSIAVDTMARHIYWVDTDLKRIEFGEFDGSHRQVLIDGDIGQPQGLYVYGDHLYWVDKSINALERVNKLNGSNRVRLYIGQQTSDKTN
jgi:low density lipoprotein receptor-related protein 5/6